jgi:hypothetical protein
MFVAITTLAREVESFVQGPVSVAALLGRSEFITDRLKRPEGGEMHSSWECPVRKQVSGNGSAV